MKTSLKYLESYCRVANFANIIEIVTMLAKITFKISRTVKKIRNHKL